MSTQSPPPRSCAVRLGAFALVTMGLTGWASAAPFSVWEEATLVRAEPTSEAEDRRAPTEATAPEATAPEPEPTAAGELEPTPNETEGLEPHAALSSPAQADPVPADPVPADPVPADLSSTEPIAARAEAAPAEAAPAEAAPAEAEEEQQFCRPNPLLLQVRIVGGDRGVQFAFTTPEGLWIAERTLTASEQGYVALRQDCDGETFALLRPDVRYRLDTLALTVDIDPNFALLSSQEVEVRVREAQSHASSLGMARLKYDLRAQADVRQATVSESGSVQAEYLQGPVRVEGTYSQTFSGGFSQGASVRADVEVTPELTAGVFGQVGSSVGFGVRAAVSGEPVRELPPVEARLAVDSDVEVLLDGITVQSFRAPAGRLVVRGLRPRFGTGTVTVQWREAGRTKTVTQPYAYTDPFLPGRFGLSGEAAYDVGRGFAVRASGSLALTPQIEAQASVETVGGVGQANVSAVYVNANHAVGLGATADWRAGGRQRYYGRYGYAWSEGSAGFSANIAPADFSSSFVRFDVGVKLGAAGVRGQVAYQFDRTVTAGVTVDWKLSETAAAAAFAETQGSRTRVGVRANFQLGPGQSLATGVVAGPEGARGDVEFTQQFGSDTLRLAYSTPLDASASYEFNGVVRGQVSASTRGQVSAGVQGSLAWVGGRLNASGSDDGAALLLRTGLPNVPIYVSGTSRGVTNALGDIVLTGLATRGNVRVSVNLDDLPIEISVRSASVSLNIARLGVYDYDWSENFRRSRWVQLRWSASEVAKYGVLELAGGQTLYADEEGMVLVPHFEGVLAGLLRAEDNARRCAVRIGAKGEVSCGD